MKILCDVNFKKEEEEEEEEEEEQVSNLSH